MSTPLGYPFPHVSLLMLLHRVWISFFWFSSLSTVQPSFCQWMPLALLSIRTFYPSDPLSQENYRVVYSFPFTFLLYNFWLFEKTFLHSFLLLVLLLPRTCSLYPYVSISLYFSRFSSSPFPVSRLGSSGIPPLPSTVASMSTGATGRQVGNLVS